MVATRSQIRKKRLPVKAKDIPPYLIYEVMDGKPIYYEGFKEVLTKEKTFEEIMGSSRLQTRIIMAIISYILKNISEEVYEIVTNEFGLHIGQGSNLSGDIGIYEITQLEDSIDEDKYFNIPPKIMIEIDTQANMDYVLDNDYFHKKTQKLLDFGVEKVIWYYTNSKKVMVAEKDKSWTIDDWDKNIKVMPDLNLCLTDLMAKKGIII
ncbi:MAG: Uma2 family endonuclease [Arcicella sp.]|jgi:Uma2 family endonuclease|nr:Uma2 family endonuclease [Arcicella sp.]